MKDTDRPTAVVGWIYVLQGGPEGIAYPAHSMKAYMGD
jgi:hypothetical protein